MGTASLIFEVNDHQHVNMNEETISKSSTIPQNAKLSLEKIINDTNANYPSTTTAVSELESNRGKSPEARFTRFRIHYLIVHVAIMLADGLQGTHLYVLYESYGYSVASLYSLGFLTGAITSPLIGPSVDYFGRRKSALLYCALEMLINSLEVFDNIYGLIISRMIGGITTNLLFCVFESWLITEHRRLKFSEDKLEILMRDSVIASNLSAIISGMLAHVLAMNFGNAGPFQGAVLCTALAFCLVTRWEENYGGMKQHKEHQQDAHEYTKSNDDPQNQADSNESSVVKFMGKFKGLLLLNLFLT